MRSQTHTAPGQTTTQPTTTTTTHQHTKQVGDRFVLNMLGASTFEPLMKHFLKRFGAGADRFEASVGALCLMRGGGVS